jgi:hypothetical protein
MHVSRRQFVIFAASTVSAATLPVSSRAAAPVLSESDPTAQSLGYRTDAARVDKSKFPKYQPGDACANCQFYQGKPSAEMGPCSIYGGKLVSAKGWCNAYVKKA